MTEWMVAIEWKDDRGKMWAVRRVAFAEDAASAVMLTLTEAPEQVRWGVFKIHVRDRKVYGNGAKGL
jgi:hypothetical protein